MTDRERLIEDMQAERRAWAEFERRDGFANGFVLGILTTCLALLLLVLVPHMLGWWA